MISGIAKYTKEISLEIPHDNPQNVSPSPLKIKIGQVLWKQLGFVKKWKSSSFETGLLFAQLTGMKMFILTLREDAQLCHSCATVQRKQNNVNVYSYIS